MKEGAQVEANAGLEDVGMETKPERDWVGLLAPTLMAVIVSLAMQVGGYLWFMGSMQQRVTNQDLRLKVIEDGFASMDKVYVPRVELEDQERMTAEQRDDVKRRLDRIDNKLDVILEGHR